MSFKRPRTFAFAVAAGCVVACAKGGEGNLKLPPETFGGDDDSGAIGSGSGGGTSTGSGDDATVGGGSSGSCAGGCTTDSDCQSSCGAPASGGIYCCDVASASCVQLTGSSCPAQDDAGGGTSSGGMMPI